MKKKLLRLSSILLILILASFVLCQCSVFITLTGTKWKVTDRNVVYDFRSSTEVYEINNDAKLAFKYDYNIEDGFVYFDFEGKHIMTFKYENDRLTLVPIGDSKDVIVAEKQE